MGVHFVQQRAKTICANQVKGILGTICMKLFPILTSGSGGMLFKDFSNYSSSGHLVQWSGMIFVILIEGIMGNICVKLF